MSKIQNMMSGAYDAGCPTKRVFWRPVTDTTVLKEGQPVCYSSDSVLDYKERAVDPTHLGLTVDTYAEGDQEMTGRLFVVEEPLTANLHAFAGIVKSLGPKAGKDGDFIEIFVPTEGMVVPVYTDENCTNERTVLGIRNGEASVSYPGGLQIGIAQENKDRSGGTSDGIVWMRFQSAPFRNANADWLIDDEADSSNVIAQYIRYETAQTTGAFSALWCRAKASAGAYANSAAGGGLAAYFRAEWSATVDASICAVHIQLVHSAGTPTGYISPLHVKLAISAGTMTSVGRTHPLRLEVSCAVDPSTHCYSWIFLENNGTYPPDYLIDTASVTDIPMVAAAGAAAVTHVIPISVGGVEYWIMVKNVNA